MAQFVDFSQRSLWISALAIAFNPTFWNFSARAEHRTRLITKLFRGNALHGCYALALTIFCIGLIRDALYERALRSQPTHPLLTGPLITTLSYFLLTIGNVLVLSSMYALGITGTYLGDYFGILLDEPVTSFPFSVTDAPMYYGSTMSFLGTALWFGKPAGLLLSAEILLAYKIALSFEDPFTAKIYAKRDRDRRVGRKGA